MKKNQGMVDEVNNEITPWEYIRKSWRIAYEEENNIMT